MDKDKITGLYYFLIGVCVGEIIYLGYEYMKNARKQKDLEKEIEKIESIQALKNAVGSMQVYVYEPKHWQDEVSEIKQDKVYTQNAEKV